MFQRGRDDKIRAKAETDGPVLDLSNAYLGDEGCADVVRILREYPSKRLLDLRGNRIQADGITILAAMLKTTMTIEHVNLEWNCIGVLDHGVESLANALALNTSLTSIDLRNNSIGPDGAVILAHALKRNRTLEEMDLRWNEVGSVGGRAFLDVLENGNHSLKRLQLMGNNVPIATSDAIDDYLKRNNHLGNLQDAHDDSLHELRGPECSNLMDAARCSDDGLVQPSDDNAKLLLAYLADKDALTSQIDTLQRSLRSLEAQVEARDATAQQLERELQVARDDRERHIRREGQERDRADDIARLLDQSEARRKHEADESSARIQSLETAILQLKEAKTVAERQAQRSGEELVQAKAHHDQSVRLLEMENDKLRSSLSGVQDEAARLREQVHDGRKELDRRDGMWRIELDETKAAATRRAEVAIEGLEQQLRHANAHADAVVSELHSQKNLVESLQYQVLQMKVAHEAALGDVSKRMEAECHERLERHMAEVEGSMDELRRQRAALEKDVEKHRMHGELLREEKTRQRKVFDEELVTRERQYDELKASVVAKDDRLAAIEVECLRHTRNYAQSQDKLAALESEFENTNKMHAHRIEKLQALLAQEKQACSEAIGVAKDKERRLMEQVATLEGVVQDAERRHEQTLAAFVHDVREYVDRWSAPNRHGRRHCDGNENVDMI
ncbi:hypothetical protein H310_03546 [Aphanomyces invadans]|uniref:Uncharacterized protein n=1 Tax=Aphanomyces invadans TaxID=157072 RepID=A0A024UJ97_9STRA|nr:hypothetical protein H310_03546 [Aphanomyces invadans]ETW05897.1 hypothetical protein H310_03546 [Aphanomyces invadans]|eukprot:XP_008865674.1 hypothetical protein H310_03546 [Aphanomyces invadans]